MTRERWEDSRDGVEAWLYTDHWGAMVRQTADGSAWYAALQSVRTGLWTYEPEGTYPTMVGAKRAARAAIKRMRKASPMNCPFCGEVGRLNTTQRTFFYGAVRDTEPDGWRNAVRCGRCGATGPARETETEAREEWLMRADTTTTGDSV